MIQGLGYLLTQISDYEALTTLAQQGDRNHIDLKVKHIYKDTPPPIPGELTAANFGNVLHHLDAIYISKSTSIGCRCCWRGNHNDVHYCSS